MAVTLFKDTTYNLMNLVENIRRGEIALPDIQRPFVWPDTKVRDLLDSMYRGYPVGYLLFWATGAEVGARQIGVGSKEAVARMLIVDGQQRLTSLFALLTGAPVVRKDYSEGHIRIAFNPAEERFEVADAAIERDAEFVPDVTEIWRSYRETARRYLSRLEKQRGEAVSDAEAERLEGALDRLRDLQHYPFNAVELDTAVDEERMAQVFVRINSQGVTLNQADFILTLMSVFWEDGRRQLESFARSAKAPTQGEATPYNHLIQPAPDQMLRVSVGVAFRRGRLQHVYSILRGKDLDTGEVSPARRDEQFARLREAQDSILNLTHWHEFLKCVSRAGFRSSRMISSETALLYTYVLWLVGRRDYAVELPRLREVIARWFFMAQTTGRYSNSPESQLESDLLRLRGLQPNDATGFCDLLDREIATVFTSDYWAISLPNRLDSSAAKSPALLAYWAALNLLDAELLFSTTKVSTRLDPGVSPVRDVERHHLFPKAYLEKLNVRGPARTNQIANMVFIDWADNVALSDTPPAEYWPFMAAQLDPQRLKQHRYWHALPVGWEQLTYDEFLEKRRKLIGSVIRDGFDKLRTATTRQTAASVGELIAAGESLGVEFKSSARWSIRGNVVDNKLEAVIVKSVAGFMNAEGGTLLIGVADDGTVLGLDPDYKTLQKPNRDGYEVFLGNLLKGRLSDAGHTLARVSFDAVNGRDVCRVEVAASARPVFVRPAEGKDATDFFARIGNSTRPLVGTEMVHYQQEHWT